MITMSEKNNVSLKSLICIHFYVIILKCLNKMLLYRNKNHTNLRCNNVFKKVLIIFLQRFKNAVVLTNRFWGMSVQIYRPRCFRMPIHA